MQPKTDSFSSTSKTLASNIYIHIHFLLAGKPYASLNLFLQIQLSISKMKFVAAYLLAVLGGNTSPNAGDMKNILSSVGVDSEDERIEILLKEVQGKDITKLIACGREKLASVPSGGGAVAVAAPASGAGGAAAPAAAEAKVEKVEEKDESDDDLGFSLFD